MNPDSCVQTQPMEDAMTLGKSVFLTNLMVVLAFGSTALADTIHMKNGDRLTGTIIMMENNVLTFKTSYAGDIKIAWDEITHVETDTSVHVVLGDQTSAHGMVKTTSSGDLQLQSENLMEPLQFHTGHVTGINPPDIPPVKVTGRINAGVDIKRGNTDTDAYHIDGEVIARTEANRYTIGAEANREEESEQKTADNWLLYTGYDHFFSQKWFFYTNANFEQDDFKDLDLRTTVGAGAGHQFFETEEKNLSLRGGLAYVNEDYSVESQDKDYTAGRWAVKYEQFFFERFIQLFHLHEGVVSLEDTEDIFIRTRTGVRLPLKKGFNTTLQYNWDWDNSPAPDKDKVDERYLFTVGYTWE